MPFAKRSEGAAERYRPRLRAVVAAGMLDPGSEWTVFRALQLANFTHRALSRRRREHPRGASRGAGRRRRPHRRSPRRCRGRRRVRASAGGGALGGRHARGGAGQDRDVARSRALSRRRRSCSVAARSSAFAGGWQPLLSYDTVLANFAPELERVPPPDSPAPLLEFFPAGLTTAEVALLLAYGLRSGARAGGGRAHAARARRVGWRGA